MAREFRFEITGDFVMRAEDIWPDGDGPANPTVDDVWTAFRKSGDKLRAFSDWNLSNDINVGIFALDEDLCDND